MKQRKTIVIGVTGGIAAYKLADLCSRLVKQQFDVHVIMTKHATEFITPLTFETLTGNRCVTDTFDRNFTWDIQHISIAKKADAMLVAPATANVIAKLAQGMADDMLTTTILAARCDVLIAPSMNTAMYEHCATQRNLKVLQEYGYHIIDPDVGLLACKDVGKGKLPDTDTLWHALMQRVAYQKDLAGIRLLVTAGPTRESIDPVRFLSNPSTGKMGYAIAAAAMLRGAQVTLISGSTHQADLYGVQHVHVTSASEMFEQVRQHAPFVDIVVKAAAVADFTPTQVSQHKIKKGINQQISVCLTRTQDILHWLGQHKTANQVICGFAMETEHLVEYAQQKLDRKKADMMVANHLAQEGAGFGSDTNIVTLITKDEVRPLEKMSKQDVAHAILTDLAAMYQRGKSGASGE